MPPGLTEHPRFGLPIDPDLGKPWPEVFDLPLPAVASAAQPDTAGDRATDFSTPTILFRWGSGLAMTPVMIPEPGSALLLGATLAALGAARRSRRGE
jgi:hypothetical protein